jgi:hypothetical protein
MLQIPHFRDAFTHVCPSNPTYMLPELAKWLGALGYFFPRHPSFCEG